MTILGEIRKDYFTNRLVINSEARARRPAEFEAKGKSKCAFCPGRESLTPPGELVLVERKDAIAVMVDQVEPVKNWTVRAFANKFPAVSPSKVPLLKPDFDAEPAYGFQYVIVATPNHKLSFHQLPVKQWHRALTAFQELTKRLLHREGVQYVYGFINQGEQAGASLSHPHLQLLTLSATPPLIQEELKGMDGLASNTCKLCTVLEKELNGPRLVLKGEQFAAFTPWASTHAYEFWIAPTVHQTTILETTSKQLGNVSEVIRSTLSALARVLHNPDFNLVFHISPRNHTEGKLHWHIEVYPHVTKWAGLERGARVYINQVTPEEAARKLSSRIRH